MQVALDKLAHAPRSEAAPKHLTQPDVAPVRRSGGGPGLTGTPWSLLAGGEAMLARSASNRSSRDDPVHYPGQTRCTG